MSIIFTIHVRKRMEERGISVEEIKQCVFGPDRIWMGEEDKHYFKKSFGYDMLEVVAERKGKHYIIITAYYL